MTLSQKFYHKLYKSGFRYDGVTHAPLYMTISQKFYLKLYKSSFLYDGVTHDPLNMTMSQKSGFLYHEVAHACLYFSSQTLQVVLS